jgi:hypothetical protein
MKKLSQLLTALMITAATFAQNAPTNGSVEAFYDASTGMISYRNFGDVTKDGVKLIDLKTNALDKYVLKTNPGNVEMTLIEKEKSDLAKLRERLLLQRERMMTAQPPMQEMH